MTITVDEVLSAAKWQDLGVPRTDDSLRALRKRLHPDVCRDPGATDAFTRLEALFNMPEFDLRVASGERSGNGIRWTVKDGFKDLEAVAVRVMGDLSHCPEPRFFTRVTAGAPGIHVRYAEETGERWWFLKDFGSLDSRTVVWVAKRISAAIRVADKSGWAHGDIHPGTVVLLPSQHGLKLDGWWGAVKNGQKLVASPTGKTPNRYLRGAVADSALSVGQAAAMLLGISNPDAAIKAVLVKHSSNPGDALAFFNEMDSAAKRTYGEPKWHPLPEPTTPSI